MRCVTLVCLVAAAVGFASAFNRKIWHETVNEPTCRPAEVRYINLDLPPQYRWLDIATEFRSGLLAYRDSVVKMFGVPNWLLLLASKLVTLVDRLFPSEMFEEIRGVSEATGIPFTEMLGINIIYSLTAGCTSIVAKGSDGTVWHARNLDYPGAQALANVTVQVKYQRQNKTVFEVTTFVGYVGTMTGMVGGDFAISLNERYSGSLLDNIFALFLTSGWRSSAFMLRNYLETAPPFKDVVSGIQSAYTPAPSYVIISGPDNGTVVTRQRHGSADTVWLDAQHWFRLETNFDSWKPAGDKRRAAATKLMTQLGPDQLTAHTLMQVLSTPPLKNAITAYSIVMRPAASEPDQICVWRP